MKNWMRRRSICSNCRGKLDSDRLISSRKYKNIYQELNQAKNELFIKNKNEAFCKIHRKKSEYFCIDCKVIICMEWLVKKNHIHWSFEPFTNTHNQYKTKLSKQLKVLNALKDNLENSFRFDKSESAEHKIDQKIDSIRGMFTQKLDEPHKELK